MLNKTRESFNVTAAEYQNSEMKYVEHEMNNVKKAEIAGYTLPKL
jgi:hypothetical protein